MEAVNDRHDQADELDDGYPVAEPGRVQFGPAAGNSIPADWVEPLLARLWAAHPEQFGQQLMELYLEMRLDGLEGFRVTRTRNR
jgi:hypothetical protein